MSDILIFICMPIFICLAGVLTIYLFPINLWKQYGKESVEITHLERHRVLYSDNCTSIILGDLQLNGLVSVTCYDSFVLAGNLYLFMKPLIYPYSLFHIVGEKKYRLTLFKIGNSELILGLRSSTSRIVLSQSQ